MRSIGISLATALAACCVFAQQTADKPAALNLKFAESSALINSSATIPEDLTSMYFDAKSYRGDEKVAKGMMRNLYPGIDAAVFRDKSSIEYVFRVTTGADPSRIKMLIEGWNPNLSAHSATLSAELNGIQIRQSAPAVFLKDKDGMRKIGADYELSPDNSLQIRPAQELVNGSRRLNGTRMNKVPSGGQPGGPMHDFFMSRNETTHEQFAKFLNDAEANKSSSRGANMHFDEDGNVWINPDMARGRDEMFSIYESRLEYDGKAPAGKRYNHIQEKNSAPYTNHPIEGVSWFGAVKYCNWLTLESGRGIAELCYTEGSNSLDWAPVTATNWANGRFDDAERALFLKKKGFRLPMLNCGVNNITTNRFNEFYKAAANGIGTNTLYGDGSRTFEPGKYIYDKGTVPVGSMDGKTIINGQVMPRNKNRYGINDLSGNAAEWTTDLVPGQKDLKMAQCGGAYFNNVLPLNVGKAVRPSNASGGAGIRVSTTFMPEETLYIHVVVSFFRQSSLAPPPVKENEFAVAGEKEGEEVKTTAGGKPTGKPGITTIDLSIPGTGESRAQPTGVIFPGKPGGSQGGGTGTGGGEGGGGGGEGGGGGTPVKPDKTGGGGGGGVPVTRQTITISAADRPLGANTASIPAAVPIAVAPVDLYTNANGITYFTREYWSITTVMLTAPLNNGGLIFKQWLQNGFHYSSNRTANVLMSASNDMEAVYVPSRLVNISSVNPAAGVPIVVSLPDANGNGNGITGPFSRTYADDTGVELTAPAASGGNVFRYWLRNGVFFSSNLTSSLLMDNNYNMTAEYIEPPRNLSIRSLPAPGAPITVSAADINGNQNGTTDFTRTYTNGASVNLTAPFTSGTRIFSRWDIDGVFLTTNLTANINNLTADRTAAAVYVDSQVLTIQSTPNVGLAMTLDTADVYGNQNGNTVFTRTFTNSPTVSITAPATSGTRIFINWQKNGVTVTTNLTASVLMDANHTMLAVYSEPRTLTVQSSPVAGVAITVSAADIGGNTDGTTQFTRTYTNGAPVNLTAPATAGTRVFVSWIQDGVFFTSNLTANVTMSANHILIANYVDAYTLTVRSSPNPGANITVSKPDISGNADGTTQFTRTYTNGSAVNLTAPFTLGTQVFEKWTQDGVDFTTNVTAAVTMGAAHILEAVYKDYYSLTVNSTPAAGIPMTVDRADAYGSQNGTTAFIRYYTNGPNVSVIAPFTSGTSIFEKWVLDGVDLTTNLTATVSMTANHTLSASYSGARILTVQSTPVAGISMTVSQSDVYGNANGNTEFTRTYTNSPNVNITAPFSSGTRVFAKWVLDGADLTTNLTASVNMAANHTLAASYVDSATLTVQSSGAAGVAMTVTKTDINGDGNGATTFTRTYTNAPSVDVTAPYVVGSTVFQKWVLDGVDLTTNLTATVAMGANHTLVAAYMTAVTLTVQSAPAAGVSVTVGTSDVNGNGNGNTTFTRQYTNGTPVTLSAPYIVGARVFEKWTEGAVDLTTNLSVAVTMTANRTLTANYVDSRTLAIQSTPISGVNITVDKNDIYGDNNGATTFSRLFTNSPNVNITAPYLVGTKVFEKWIQDGVDLTTNLTATVNMAANHTLVASYIDARTLNVQSTPIAGVSITVDKPDINSDGNGSTAFSRLYTNSPSVNLTAPYTVGTSVFVKWVQDGVDLTTNLIATVSMAADHTLVASYVSARVLTVQSTPAAGVAITVGLTDVNGDKDGTTAFTRAYTNSPNVTLTAPYSSGTTVFEKWVLDGVDLTTNLTATVSVAADHTIVASYVDARTLSVQSSPAAGISMTLSRNDINGDKDGMTAFTRTYTNSPSVDVTAPYISGTRVFVKWTDGGADLTANLTATVTMNANHTLVAEYTDSRLLTLQSSPITGVGLTVDKTDIYGSANGSTEFTRSYTNGSTVNVTAPLRPVSSMVFSKWTLDGVDLTTNLTANVTMNAAHTLAAVYVVSDWNLNIQSSPGTGIGMTVSIPDKNAQQNGSTDFTRLYTNNSFVQVTAPAISGTKYFDRWRMDGIPLTTNLTANVTMDSDHTIVAYYTDSRSINVRSSPVSGIPVTVDKIDLFGNQNGNTEFTRYYTNNSQVNITAPGTFGSYLFIKWIIDGTITETNFTATVTMDLTVGRTMVAFYVEPVVLTVNSTPNNGVPITIGTMDVYDNKDGFTEFTRIYTNGQSTTLTAPATSGTRIFVGWLKDGTLDTTNLTTSLLMDNSYAMTAQYTEPRQLTVQSTPDSGVSMTVDTTDLGGSKDGSTTFTRTYTNNTAVSVTAPYLVGTKVFEKWIQDGSDLTTNLTAAVAMAANHTIVASYIDTKTLTVQSTPDSGIAMTVSKVDIYGSANGNTAFSRQYTNNSSVDVTAPYIVGTKVFQKWTQDAVDLTTNLTANVTMDANHTMVAVYVDARTLTIQSIPGTGIPITVDKTDITGSANGTTDFTRQYTNSPTVAITAPRIVGTRVFDKWIQDSVDLTTNLTASVDMSANHTLVASYVDSRTLTVQSAPDTGISITVDKADINGSANGTTEFTRQYTNSPTVNLTAPYTVGTKVFQKWVQDGTDLTTNLTATVAMSADHTLVATYIDARTLTVQSTPDSGVSITVSRADISGAADGSTAFTRTYTNGPTVDITAPYIVGTKVFQKWTQDAVDLTTNFTASVNMSADHTLVAVYINSRTLSIQSSPDSGVSITVGTADIYGNTDGNTTFTRTYTNSPTVDITATYIVGAKVFSRWTQDGVDLTTNLTASVSAAADHTLIAYYVDTRILTVQSTPASGVSITASKTDINGNDNGSTTFTRQYTNNSLVDVTAPYISGTSVFQKWTEGGSDLTTNLTVSVTMSADHTLVATYVDSKTLTVLSTPDPGVAITVSKADISGATDGSTTFTRTYTNSPSVDITAPRFVGTKVFQKWIEGAVDVTTNLSTTVNMSADHSLTAVYIDTKTLTVNSINPASGVTITVDTADVNGNTDDTTAFSRQYTNSPSVTITAPYTTGAGTKVFQKWTEGGSDVTTNLSTTVNMSADHSLTAVYIDSRTLTVNSVNPAAGVTITVGTADINGDTDGATAFSRQYTNSPSVTITAPYTTSAGTKVFQKWTDGGSDVTTNLSTTVDMSLDHSMEAVYVDSWVLTVQSTPDTTIAMTVDITDIFGNKDGSTQMTRTYTNGPTVTVTAPYLNGATEVFQKWTLDAADLTTNLSASVSMTADHTLVAVYGEAKVLTVESTPNSVIAITVGTTDINGNNDGTTTFTRSYTNSPTVNITAPATDGSGNVFLKWLQDGLQLTTNLTAAVDMSSDHTLTASYVKLWTLTVESPPDTVAMTVLPLDFQLRGNGTTPFTRDYTNGTSVTVTAPPTTGGTKVFEKWQKGGADYTTNLAATLAMTADATLRAFYVIPSNLTVTLFFNPNPINYTDAGSTLTATASGGSGIYDTYTYEFRMLYWYMLDPNTKWRASTLTGPVNFYNWDYSVIYRVYVTDSFGATSQWAEATLIVNGSPTNAPPNTKGVL